MSWEDRQHEQRHWAAPGGRVTHHAQLDMALAESVALAGAHQRATN